MGFSVEPGASNNEGDALAMKPPAIVSSPSWPCANCHTTVSSERCPTCQGVQVRILDNKMRELRTQAFLERLSPAVFARQTPTQEDSMMIADEEYAFRPLDPVACILASAPSPIHVEKQKLTIQTPLLQEIEDRLRFRKRPVGVVAEVPTPKKTKWLSAV